MREVKIRDFITKKEGYTQEFNGVDLTGTTWVFGNELPRYATTSRAFNINFNSGDNEFIQIYSRDDYIGMCDLIYYKADGAFYTVLDYNYESGGYYSLNHGEVYKTIHITGGSDVTDSSFISWLQSCATFVPKTLYTYNVEIAGANNYGEGPKTAVELNLTSVPFTINRQEFIFQDKNGWYLTDISNGAPSDEILKCGQILTITYLPGLTGRLFPKNEQLLTANNADVITEASEDQKSLTATVSNITGPIDFMFTDFKHSIPLTIYDLEGNIANELITNANTWQEVVDDETNDLFAMEGTVYM